MGRHNLSSKFQKLVRCDWAEMYFNKIMALRDITNDVTCQNQVKEFLDLVENQWWPEFNKFQNNTVLPLKRLSRSSDQRTT